MSALIHHVVLQTPNPVYWEAEVFFVFCFFLNRFRKLPKELRLKHDTAQQRDNLLQGRVLQLLESQRGALGWLSHLLVCAFSSGCHNYNKLDWLSQFPNWTVQCLTRARQRSSKGLILRLWKSWGWKQTVSLGDTTFFKVLFEGINYPVLSSYSIYKGLGQHQTLEKHIMGIYSPIPKRRALIRWTKSFGSIRISKKNVQIILK